MITETININPLCDFGFKRIFGTEENKDILAAFLNSTISHQVGIIKDLQYLNPEQLGSLPSEKHIIYDIYCTNHKGEKFIIEMQRGKQNHFSNRIISYVARAICQSLKRGDRVYQFPNIYSFNLLDFNANEFQGRDRFFWTISLKDDDHQIFSSKITMFFIELRKFAAQVSNVSPDNEMHQWLYLLKNLQNLKREDFPAGNSVFDRIFELCNYSNLNNMEKENYRTSILEYEDVQDVVACTREESYADGLADGIEKGIEQGIEQGVLEGKIQTAQKLLSLGVDISTIVAATGLSEEKILRTKGWKD